MGQNGNIVKNYSAQFANRDSSLTHKLQLNYEPFRYSEKIYI